MLNWPADRETTDRWADQVEPRFAAARYAAFIRPPEMSV